MAARRARRSALVLGAGGVLGGAWIVGALHAIATESGWDPGSADYIVGTSAGSMIGALLACGTPPWFMVAHSAGEEFDGFADAQGEPRESVTAPRERPTDWTGAGSPSDRGRGDSPSPRWRVRIGIRRRPMISGWLPRGVISTEPLKETVRRANPEGWAPHPNFWAMAVDYATGQRVAFGRHGSPAADLADAVAASCAIPGFYRAVDIARTFVRRRRGALNLQSRRARRSSRSTS